VATSGTSTRRWRPLYIRCDAEALGPDDDDPAHSWPPSIPPDADALLHPTIPQDIVEIRKEKNLSSPERVGGNTFGVRLE
jgi:hypothetical protein